MSTEMDVTRHIYAPSPLLSDEVHDVPGTQCSPCQLSLSPHRHIGAIESSLPLYMSPRPFAYMMMHVNCDHHLVSSILGQKSLGEAIGYRTSDGSAKRSSNSEGVVAIDDPYTSATRLWIPARGTSASGQNMGRLTDLLLLFRHTFRCCRN
jgi:hypothetical protein